MMKTQAVWLLCLASHVAASNNAIGSQGFVNITTDAFTLELDVANQVATRLIALPGTNAGSDPFNFLLPSTDRTDDGYYYLGDIQIRMRPENTDTWTDVSSHNARQQVDVTAGSGNVLTTSDITSSLGSNLPITVSRTWSKDGDSVVMTFNVTNVGQDTLEMGGVGIPLPYNDNWIGKDQQSTWSENVVSDPAISMDAGYVLTNRLTGEAPTLISAPVERTPLEQYRLNYPSQPDYPAQWLDKTGIDFNYEGIYSWWMASSGLSELDSAEAGDLGFTRGGDYNTLSSFPLDPGASRIIGIRLFTAAGPRLVEDRLSAYDRPTIVGVPGFVAGTGEQVKILIRSTSAPSISDVSPSYIHFDAPVTVSDGFYSITGTVSDGVFGQARVTIDFANGEVATAHYSIINPAATQLDNLGTFRFTKQWYDNTSDYFGRGPSIISYDKQKQAQVLDDNRAWVAGLSDEAGTGAYVSAVSKQLGRPDKQQVAMLEQFASRTIFGGIQHSEPGSNYGGVKKSLFYYDTSLEGKGVYDPSVDHSGTWDANEAGILARSYDYPHVTLVYWILYRLARNYNGLTTIPWTWYIDRAYDTIMAMQNLAGTSNGYAQFGLMEGTYFQQVLLDLIREGETNSTLSSRADDVKNFMKERADIWNGEQYPYASEFPWDNTGQEEVYAWTSYFGYAEKAEATIETLMAVMSSVPHWGYSGTGRDLWDFLYSAQFGPGARIERILHHYKGAQSALPLVTQFQADPSDVKMLRAGYGGVLGPLTSIDPDGFGSTGFHSRPDYLAWDPLSGDNGVTIALHALSTRAVAVNHDSLGGWAGFGAHVDLAGTTVSITPTDSFRQRVFIAENALYLELDAGYFKTVTYDTASREVQATFDAGDNYTPNARLRWSTTASTSKSGTYSIQGTYDSERGASVVPLSDSPTTVTLTP